MKKQQNKIDEYFREALHDHTVVPSEAAKAAFLKEAATLKGSRKSNRYWYLYLSAFLLLVSAGTGLLLVHPDAVTSTKTSSSNSLDERRANSIAPQEQSESEFTSKNGMARKKNSIKKINITSQEKDQNITISNNNPSKKRNEFAQPDLSSSAVEKNKTTNTTFELQTKQPSTELQSPISTRPISNEPGKNDSVNVPPAKSTDTLTIEKSLSTTPKPGSGRTPKNLNVAIGIYYAPEWLFNTLEGEKYVNNFGIEGTFHFGRYSIRTGAGLSITKGTHELSVNYNDYLGKYNKLDSIQFTWNATHSNMVPTYYFSTENVWDSLLKVADARVVKRYTYLQVPLILGYDFWQNDRFSIGLRAGPILSVLLKTDILSDNYDPGMDKIILINRIAPERIQTNWQIMGGIHAMVHFSRRLGIEIEPEIRYYFNSVYEKSANDKKPWSVGIHAAFLVIL